MAKYTFDQVVRGIECFAEECFCEPFSLELDTPLHEKHWETLLAHEICALEFIELLADFFGFQFSQKRVYAWLQVTNGELVQGRCCNHQTTVSPKTGRDLVELIMSRATCPDFSPKTILGNTCEKAGCFLGIVSMIPQPKRIAPSTPIRHVLSDHRYQELVSRLTWMFGAKEFGQRTQPTRYPVDRLVEAVSCFWLLPSIFIGMCVGVITHFVIGAILSVLVGIFTIGMTHQVGRWYKQVRNLDHCNGICTFRDLTNELLAV